MTSPAGAIHVRIDDKDVVYDFERASNELEPAYAVTVHKSQGNEFPAVVIPVLDPPRQLCYRNLLYTGVTRAKQLLILVGRRGRHRRHGGEQPQNQALYRPKVVPPKPEGGALRLGKRKPAALHPSRAAGFSPV